MTPFIWLFNGHSPISWCIKKMTGGVVSHCEIQISPTELRGAHSRKGVRTIPILEMTKKTNPKDYVIVTIDESIFKSHRQQVLLGNWVVKQANLIKEKYNKRLIFAFAWRAIARRLGLKCIPKMAAYLSGNRQRVVCSHFVDICFDPMEKVLKRDLFLGEWFLGKDGGWAENYTTPHDILKSPNIVYVAGSKELFDKSQKQRMLKERRNGETK